jgi:hypothetical protein
MFIRFCDQKQGMGSEIVGNCPNAPKTVRRPTKPAKMNVAMAVLGLLGRLNYRSSFTLRDLVPDASPEAFVTLLQLIVFQAISVAPSGSRCATSGSDWRP